MKKNIILSVISLFALLLTVGCESQSTIEVPSDNYVTGTLEISQDYLITTKAPSGMQLRYTIEIYANEESNVFKTIRSYDSTVELSLVKGYSYQIAIWGDYVSDQQTDLGDLYYNTESLAEVTAITTSEEAIDAASEAKDAFYAPVISTGTINDSFTFSVELSRAVANIMLINNSQLTSDQTVTVKYTPSYDTFNVYENVVINSSDIADESTTTEYTATYNATSGTTTIANEYFFAPSDESDEVCSVTFAVNDGTENTVTIKRNYKTNVTGSFITTDSE